jgi:hypothetical protein
VLKKLFPTPQNEGRLPSDQEGGVKSTDFWTDEVKVKMEAAKKAIRDRRRREGQALSPGASKSKVAFHLKRCPSCGIAIDPKKQRCSKCVDGMLSRKGWDGNTCDLPTTNASVRVPSTVIEKESPTKKTQAKPMSLVHIQSIDSLSHWGVYADGSEGEACTSGNGNAGEIIKNGFKNPLAAKQWTKREYPQAQIIVWQSI